MKTAIVLGTFDGLHKGHRAVIEQAQGFYTVAVTFGIPPKAFFGGGRELLITSSDKLLALKTLGVDEVFTLDFSKIFNMPPQDFFVFLKEKYSPSLIACGFNYRFGSGASGDINMLASLCKNAGIEFRCAEAVGSDNPISSSALREMVVSGNVKDANKEKFGGFGFTSEVIHGDARGKGLGFPTINQKFPDELVKPLFGVYKSKVIVKGIEYESITNIGVRPTYQTDYVGCETYLKGFNENVYGEQVTLKFIEFIRKEEKFSTADALKTAVREDIKAVLGVEIE